MTLLHAFLLGIIQGLTEFIPVSSTAHLLIGQKLLGIPADGAMFSFLVIVQLGTLVSLFAFYWKDLLTIVSSTFQVSRSMLTKPRETWNLKPESLLGWYILIATIPALLAGYLLKDAVEALFQQPMLQASIRLFSAAILLTLAELLTKKNRNLESMTWLDALVIGLFQIIAVFPGASRSGTTISGGMFRGLDRPSAARFAFLMSVPVMLAAGGYEMLDVMNMPYLSGFLPLLAVGFVTAAIVGWFAIKWLIDYLSKRSLYVFAVYCAVVGTVVLIFS
ncbi:MAG: undecaprenyl-diphosphatase UppP [Anaerolineae bacterium]|nr:undecaprenyl-diphosphatase UppP [Anaerolineae bacterium]MBL8105370.1 undecaprenyl-diphosphatase UppP [Anaerolineales bacterium]MCC7190871.1 undecaprenyl-diphosphatase UppP [Anaerolineales bacterium]